jgi:hypothetical protein
MMYLKSFIFLFLVSVVLAFAPAGQASLSIDDPLRLQSDPCSSVNYAFKSGEEVVYKLYYNWNFIWLSAGEVTFKTEELPHAYKLTATGRTYASYEWFFKVRDYYEAIIDKETLKPISTIRDIQEGGYSLYERVAYDQQGNKVVSQRGRSKSDLKTKEFTLNGCAHDVLSAIYYMRNQEYSKLKTGSVLPIKVFLDREEYDLNILYSGGGHNIDVKGHGKFKTILLSPQTIAGTVFSEGAEMKVYASDDNNRLPLLIDSPVSVGSIKAVLKSHKNLRHPLTSKL